VCARARAFVERVSILIIVLYIHLLNALDVTQFKICLQFAFFFGGGGGGSTPGQRFYRRFQGWGREKERALSGTQEAQSANMARGILCLA
jgi:hypothetical protein